MIWVREEQKIDRKALSLTVKIEIEVPVGIVRFVKDVSAFTGEPFDLKKYVGQVLLEDFAAELDNISSPFRDPETLESKYGF